MTGPKNMQNYGDDNSVMPLLRFEVHSLISFFPLGTTQNLFHLELHIASYANPHQWLPGL